MERRDGGDVMGILDVLRQISPPRPSRLRSQEQAELLRRDVVRLYQEGRYRDASNAARRLVELQRNLLGERHPDYATGLHNLALLLWKDGATAEAEGLLHQALAIRRQVLGEPHIDTVAIRGALSAIEHGRTPRRALEPPPVAIAPLSSRGSSPPETSHALVPAARRPDPDLPVEAAPTPGDDLLRALSTLRDEVSALGDRLALAAQALLAPGVPLSDALIRQMDDQRRAFQELRDGTIRRARSWHLECPPAESITTLAGIATLIDEIARAGDRRVRNEVTRRRALAVLDRIARLRYAPKGEFPPLDECQAQASALRTEIASRPWSRPHDANRPLAEGRQPFAILLALIDDRGVLNDFDWARRHAELARAFGEPLAAAAARARLADPASVHGNGNGRALEPARPSIAPGYASRN